MTQESFIEIATGLRNMWPAGEKDGRYPWRDSVTNIAKRLKFIWENRDMKEYPVEDCLTAGRKYLAQFENNTKYMKLLKYFVFKQDRLVGKDGRITYTYQSTFADILESLSALEQKEEWEDILTNESLGEGELV